MARTALTVNPIGLDGVRVDDAGAANVDGHSIPNSGSESVLLYVNNGGGAPITIDFVTNHSVAGITLPDKSPSLTNGQSKMYGPFPKAVFNQASGDIHVDFSSITSVTVKAFKV